MRIMIIINNELRPLLSRVLDNVVKIIGCGWLPPLIHQDPVMWTQQDNNQLADYLCNFTMDVKRTTWKHVRLNADDSPPGCGHILAFYDGGSRPDCAASAWLIGKVVKAGEIWTFQPRVAGGIFFETPISSFLAEAIALEHATIELNQYLQI